MNLSELPSIATGHLSVFKGAGATYGVMPIGVRNAASDQYFRYDQVGPVSGTNRGLWGNVIIASATSDTAKLYAIVSRTSATSLTVYHNGSSVATATTSATPALPGRNVYLFAENNGTAGSFWPHAIFTYTIGIGLTATQASALNTAVQSFNTALGRGI
jgi:hypothetical protein